MEESQKVKLANKQFYDIIAKSYETIDGKRNKTMTAWIRAKLGNILKEFDTEPAAILLDIGCGSGFILRNTPTNVQAIGIDISFNILLSLHKQGYMVVCADSDFLPFKEQQFDIVTCFAVLHHLYSFDALFKETYRILKSKGIFYSDHDFDEAFRKHYAFLVKIYRFMFNEEKKYQKKEQRLTHHLYVHTEIHNKGVPTQKIIAAAKQAGFHVYPSCHWLGLFSQLTDFLVKHPIKCSKGNAPLFSLIAKKEQSLFSNSPLTRKR